MNIASYDRQEQSRVQYLVKLSLDAATSLDSTFEQKLDAARNAFRLSEGRPVLRERVESQLASFKAHL